MSVLNALSRWRGWSHLSMPIAKLRIIPVIPSAVFKHPHTFLYANTFTGKFHETTVQTFNPIAPKKHKLQVTTTTNYTGCTGQPKLREADTLYCNVGPEAIRDEDLLMHTLFYTSTYSSWCSFFCIVPWQLFPNAHYCVPRWNGYLGARIVCHCH